MLNLCTTPTPSPAKYKPSIMTLVGGIIATLWAICLALVSVCIWIPFIYGLVFGIMAIVKGSKLLGANPWPEYLTLDTTAIMGIVNIINGDILNMTMGIIILVFLNDPQVRAYMRLPVK
jgi:hypothetical protein